MLNLPPPPENRVVYEIMFTNIVQPDRLQMTIWCMRSAYWIAHATDDDMVHAQCILDSSRYRLTIWYMRSAYWIAHATD